MKKTSMLTLLLLLSTVAAFAQTPNCAPVDGGLSFLLIAGVAGYGAKKAAEKKKQNMQGSETAEK